MPLQIPQIGDSSYQGILTEAIERIRIHNPEWTNHNESDPGITILSLFAWMTENLLYRANRIPERNHIKFLKLLGIPLQPASSARCIVTFRNEKGPLENITLNENEEITAGNVPFRTLDAVDVLPVETKCYYKQRLKSIPETVQTFLKFNYGDKLSADPVLYETTPLDTPLDSNLLPFIDMGADIVVDRSIWMAILARPKACVNATRNKIANKILNIGIYPAEEEQAQRILLPGGEATAENRPHLIFEHATGQQSEDGTPIAGYDRLAVISQGGDPLIEPTVIKLRLPGPQKLKDWNFEEEQDKGTGDFPPLLPDENDQKRVITWIRIRLDNQNRKSGLTARICWLGINSTSVIQRTHVADEHLGQGSGEPDQTFTLTNTPVIKGSVDLMISGEIWQEIEDLSLAGPEIPARAARYKPGFKHNNVEGAFTYLTESTKSSKVFVMDRESGQIRFGNGEHGMRPPLNAVIIASYDYGGGRRGNVNIGAIKKGPLLPVGVSVINPVPSWGGDEGETPAEAEKNITRFLRHRNRLVTRTDFEDIAKTTPGVDIGRVNVLPLFHPELVDSKTPGVVTLMVVPRFDAAHPDAPQPDTRMLDLICRHMEPKRLVSTEVQVHGPHYIPIVVSVGIQVVAGQDFPPVREAVNQALKTFLSPITGGRQKSGWPLEKVVMAQELWAEAARVSGVAFVTRLLLGDEEGNPRQEIQMNGLDLPYLAKVDTRLGDPEPLDTLISGGMGMGSGGESGTGDGTGQDDETSEQIFPIPSQTPEFC